MIWIWHSGGFSHIYSFEMIPIHIFQGWPHQLVIYKQVCWTMTHKHIADYFHLCYSHEQLGFPGLQGWIELPAGRSWGEEEWERNHQIKDWSWRPVARTKFLGHARRHRGAQADASSCPVPGRYRRPRREELVVCSLPDYKIRLSKEIDRSNVIQY